MKKMYKFYVLSSTDDPDLVRYVGVTQRDSVKQRFYGHKYCATHPDKCGLPVHKWMSSKYKEGLDIIVKEIDSCSEKDWEEKERYWISVYKNKSGGKLLNLSEGGQGVIPKEARSLSSIKRSAKAHEKAITLLNKYGEVVEHCPSVKYAVEKYGIARTAVGNVLAGRSKTAKGFYIIETTKFNSPDFNVQEFFQKINDSINRRKLVYRYDLNGNFLDNGSKTDFHNKYHSNPNAILKAIRDKTIYQNSYWSNNNTININEFKCEFKYKYNNKLYRTLKELAEELGLKACTLTNARRFNKKVKGYYIENYQR